MTTLIENLDSDFEITPDFDMDDSKIKENILNNELPTDTRISLINTMYSEQPDEVIELIVTLGISLQMSNSSVLLQLLEQICINSNLNSLLKIETANHIINTSNSKIGYKCIDTIFQNLDEDLPTPCRVKALFSLMEYKDFYTSVLKYLRDFIYADNIEIEYIYKTLLNIEDIVYTDIKDTENSNFDTALSKYNETHEERYYKYDYLHNSMWTFFTKEDNRTYYRLLSGQYLLQKCIITPEEREIIQNTLLTFSQTHDLDYDLRADAADILMRLGTNEMKIHGRNIINELGYQNTNTRTVFTNAQNVHTLEVEESLVEILEFLNTVPMMMNGENNIDYHFVNNKIEDMLQELVKSKSRQDEEVETICDFCETATTTHILSGDELFCDDECLKLFTKSNKIRVALNRIYMDRALYSKFNTSLLNILLKIWSYLDKHEHKEEMEQRLLEELEEMAGTCSSGFATRLVNVISGFGDFNIRISFSDQIIANFTGRLNAHARNITKEQIFKEPKKLTDIIALSSTPTTKVADLSPEQVDTLIEDFQTTVLEEMIIAGEGNYVTRRSFSLFFNTFVSAIREEMYNEFREFITDTDYDLAIRKAIMTYENSI